MLVVLQVQHEEVLERSVCVQHRGFEEEVLRKEGMCFVCLWIAVRAGQVLERQVYRRFRQVLEKVFLAGVRQLRSLLPVRYMEVLEWEVCLRHPHFSAKVLPLWGPSS